MKKLTLIILAVALAATAANADDYYFCFTGGNNCLNFAKIPGQGTYNGLDIVHTVPIGFNSDALTYDGEYWWSYYNQEIYCFDQSGDYVRSFPRPVPNFVNALGWDGQYLWIEGHDNLYQRDIYGGVGPFDYIEISEFFKTSSCTIKDDRIIIGNDWNDDSPVYLELNVYDFSGNFLFTGYEKLSWYDTSFGSLAYHDGIVWVSYYYYDGDNPPTMETYGLEYREGQNFIKRTTIENYAGFDLAICDADFINIASSSLGKIKAYFADK